MNTDDMYENRVELNQKFQDTEIISLTDDIDEYFKSEGLPHVSDAWIDEEHTRICYEIPFTSYFYKYTKQRASSEIKPEIIAIEKALRIN